jgi:hypothetical protein
VVVDQVLSLDTLTNAALDRLPRWTPDLPRSEATLYLLRYMLARLYVAGGGNVARARFQACQQTMGSRIYGKDRRGISREWTNTLLGRLAAAGWVQRLTIKVTSDRNAPCIYSAGRQLRRLIVSLLKVLLPRAKPARGVPPLKSVNSGPHSLPLPSESEHKRVLLLLKNLREALGKKFSGGS